MRDRHTPRVRGGVEDVVLVRSVHVGSFAHERLDLVGGSSGTRIVQRSDSVCIRLQSPITETRHAAQHDTCVNGAQSARRHMITTRTKPKRRTRFTCAPMRLRSRNTSPHSASSAALSVVCLQRPREQVPS